MSEDDTARLLKRCTYEDAKKRYREIVLDMAIKGQIMFQKETNWTMSEFHEQEILRGK